MNFPKFPTRSAEPQEIEVTQSPERTAPTRNRGQSGLIEVIRNSELQILQVALSAIVVLMLLKTLSPDLAQFVFQWKLHLPAPLVLIYVSSKFRWHQAAEIGLIWLFGLAPACVLV